MTWLFMLITVLWFFADWLIAAQIRAVGRKSNNKAPSIRYERYFSCPLNVVLFGGWALSGALPVWLDVICWLYVGTQAVGIVHTEKLLDYTWEELKDDDPTISEVWKKFTKGDGDA